MAESLTEKSDPEGSVTSTAPRAHILVVDDHPGKRLAIEAALGVLGHPVVTAASGQDALRRLLDEQFAVILLDVHMPDMDGFETAALIRRRRKCAHTPIIFVTAFNNAETDIARGYSLGAVDFLFAPIVPDVLRAKVGVFLDLFQRTEEVKRQAVLLRDLQEQEHRRREEAADAALRESEERYRTVAETASDAIVTIDDASTILYVNRAGERMFGYSVAELVGQPLTMLMPAGLRESHRRGLAHYVATGERRITWESVGLRALHRDGRDIPVEISFGEFFKDGRHVFTGIIRDVSERSRAEEVIKSALSEKELLLKEIHHRVKNNLQLISSLLNLQDIDAHGDPVAVGLLKESQHRIKSMALIHEKLYQSDDLSRVDFEEYVRSLAAYLFRSYQTESRVITLDVKVENVLLGVDTAIPCGLIINELVSNALKHAFLGRERGRIRIELRPDAGDPGRSILIVTDDGVGCPPGLDIRRTESLGLQLVTTLADQLGGTLTCRSEAGTEFTMAFPVEKPRHARTSLTARCA